MVAAHLYIFHQCNLIWPSALLGLPFPVLVLVFAFLFVWSWLLCFDFGFVLVAGFASLLFLVPHFALFCFARVKVGWGCYLPLLGSGLCLLRWMRSIGILVRCGGWEEESKLRDRDGTSRAEGLVDGEVVTLD